LEIIMHYRTLGQDLKVSALGLGCMPMAGVGAGMYGASNDDEAIATLGRAIDLGVTFFDTAEVYGPFRNKELVGQAIKGRRERLVIATKFGFVFDADGRQRPGEVDSSPANIQRAVEGSLKRLGIDTIDLYYQHRVDPAVPIEDTVGAMARLVEQGKVRFLGLSEAGADTIRRAHATHPIAALQSEYSLWERDVETEILPLCRQLGIGFVPYSPLGRGFLTGSITSRDQLPEGDYRRNDPRYAEGNFQANMKIVGVVQGIADGHGVSAAQVALAWLLAQDEHIVPIPGSKRRQTLEDSMAAANVTLSADDLATLDRATNGQVAGPRYGEAGMKMVRL
jgi:aryl-alcohol dehydrogenase-like predicted oxidoreductase